MKRNEYMEEIVYRHLNNETSSREEEELAAWLKESPDNLREYDELVKIWNESSKLAGEMLFDKSRAWEVVEKKISMPSSIKNVMGKSLFFKYMKIAAAIILLAGASSLIYYFVFNKNSSLINILAEGANKKLHLPDGTSVILRQGSSLQYHSDFDYSNRDIYLSGEGYFDVAPRTALKFKIFTKKCIIEDIGTSFLVKSSDNEEQVFVTTGLVKVSQKEDTSQSTILIKNQVSSLVGKVFEMDSITDNNYLSWQSGLMKFENVSLKKMIADLNDYFKTNIKMSDVLARKSDSIKVNFSFEKNSLGQVLDEIHVTTGLIVDQYKDSILLREK